ncbi:MAG: hypothetical protein NTX97_11315 [Bacteroidetes bacterium]|nr:hypothetical protein [Bacteroidota bacterium]
MIRINNNWIRIALLNFLVVATLGTFLRFAFIKELFFLDYLHFQTAHWHLAIFGWIYQAMYVFIIGAFLSPEQQAQKKYHTLFWLNQTLIIIVFLTLITKGYSFFSVDEDICFVVLIGGFVFSILKDLKISSGSKSIISSEFLKIAFFFLLLSFIGIISIIPIELLFSAKRSILYYLSSQFFLHFQYNGWFIFGIFSLFFKMIENFGIEINTEKFRQFKWLSFSAALITYFLNIFWGYPGHLVFLWIASLGGGIIQLSALLIIRKDVSKIFGELKPHLNSVTAALMKFSYISFCIKLTLQVIIAYPDLASVALTIRNYTIAYFHLVFLCIASVFLFAWNVQFNKLKLIQKNSHTGIYVFSLSILSVELLLFLQGTLLWMGVGFMTFYYESIFLLTLAIPIGIVLILFKNMKHSNFDNINK